jgi:hypothetical protein
MVEDDYQNFAELMMQAAIAATGKIEMPKERIDFYFECLIDIPLVNVRKNAIDHFRSKNGFFPSIAELRGADNDSEALNDFQEISNLLDAFSGDDMPVSLTRAALQAHLRSDQKEYLLPLAIQFAPDILDRSNPSATRAQFLKAWKGVKINGKDHKQLAEAPTLKRLGEALKEIKITGENNGND